MARLPILLLFFVASVVPMSGCLGFCNTCYFNESEGGDRIYGGVRLGCEEIHRRLTDPTKLDDHEAPLWLFIVDMPLSALWDTATLPITVPLTIWRSVRPNAEYQLDTHTVPSSPPSQETNPTRSLAPSPLSNR
jgi:hypothetical protein